MIHAFFQTKAGDFAKEMGGCLVAMFGAAIALGALAYLGLG